MANFKYFADVNGATVELERVAHDGGASKPANFTGFPKGTDYATLKFDRSNPANPWGRTTATRVIEYKSFPSKHKCDARCTSAKGFRCECECGGKNHGRGDGFECETI